MHLLEAHSCWPESDTNSYPILWYYQCSVGLCDHVKLQTNHVVLGVGLGHGQCEHSIIKIVNACCLFIEVARVESVGGIGPCVIFSVLYLIVSVCFSWTILVGMKYMYLIGPGFLLPHHYPVGFNMEYKSWKSKNKVLEHPSYQVDCIL